MLEERFRLRDARQSLYCLTGTEAGRRRDENENVDIWCIRDKQRKIGDHSYPHYLLLAYPYLH